jgi:multiple sugar transport system substrate-binding protein
MSTKRLSRREFLRRVGVGAAGLVGAGALAGCAQPTPQVQIVKETVEVVKQAPAEVKTVKETVEVVKEVVKEITPTAAAPVKLTIWHHWGGTREPLIKQAMDDFAALNPNVTVEPTLIPWDRKEETVTTAVASGTAPDVLMLNASEMPPYATNSVLVPIDDMVSGAGIKGEEVYESDWKASFYVGKQWGLPQTVGGSAFLLFMNNDALAEAKLDPKKPPTSWSDALTWTKALVQLDGKNLKRLGFGFTMDAWYWLNFLAENDAAWLSADGREVQMNSPAAAEALQYLVDISDAQGGAENIAAFSSAGGDADPFISGRTAMTYQGVWQYYIIKSNAPDLKYTSALAPNNKGNWHEANYGPHLYTLPKGTKNVPAAWKLLLWMTREQGGCDFLTAQLRPSPWKQCTENSPVAKVADYWPVVINALNSTRSEPLTPMFNKFADIWNEMIQKATRHTAKADEAVATAVDEMKKANDEYWAKQKS